MRLNRKPLISLFHEGSQLIRTSKFKSHAIKTQILPSKSAALAGIPPSLSKHASHQHQQQECQPADSFCSFRRTNKAQTEHSTSFYSAQASGIGGDRIRISIFYFF